MVDYKEALELILKNVQHLRPVDRRLQDASSHVLAENYLAAIDMPPFDQSAMDGYAVPDDGRANSSYTVIDSIPAGNSVEGMTLSPGQAMRIFTGSMIPNGCVRVIPQEYVNRELNQITILEETTGANIRLKGEQYKTGDVLAHEGQILNPGIIGFLATSGIMTVKVYQKPKVSIILTGSELVKPGSILQPGQLFESNSFMLESALKQLGLDVQIIHVKDDLEQTKQVIELTLEESDLILISGGISVGDHDHVRESLLSNGVQEIFYKVRQKPGKPLFFGMRSSKVVFGLPGNPSSVLTCFYVYVLLAIQRMMNRKKRFLRTELVHLSHDYFKKGSFTNFLRAKVEDHSVEILEHQSSAMLNAWNEANALLIIPDDVNNCATGKEFEVIRIDQFYVI